jgi:hypothetical protein
MSNRDETIDRLRGQLQNCVNHLDGVKRRYPSMSERLDACIQSANNALYETLHEDISATALQADRIEALEAQRTAYLDGKCVCPHSTAGSAEHYPGCPQQQAERVMELEEALRLLQHEMIESGNGGSDDFGWSAAIQATNKALSATAREVGE